MLIDFLLYSNNFVNINAVVVGGSGLCGFKLSGPRLFISHDSVFSQLLRYYLCVEGYPAKVGTADASIYLATLVVGSLLFNVRHSSTNWKGLAIVMAYQVYRFGT